MEQHPGMNFQNQGGGPMRQVRPGLRLDQLGDRPMPLHHEMHEVGQRPRVSRNRTTSGEFFGIFSLSPLILIHFWGLSPLIHVIHRFLFVIIVRANSGVE
ncbi:unnamed protein product, partial [Mesorhabditis spiculigera]